MKAYVLLTNGFEEVEALTTADILIRAGVEVKTVKVETPADGGCSEVSGSHGIKVVPDFSLAKGEKEAVAQLEDGDCIVLPGGMPGTKNLGACSEVVALINSYNAWGKFVAAICAAPSVLGDNGLLKGRTATCFPGFEDRLFGAEATGKGAEIDGNIITGKSMGSAVVFGLSIVEAMLGSEAAQKVEDSIYVSF